VGFQAGDVINKLEGQPLLSIADVQWVLHGTGGNGGIMTAEITRAGTNQSLTLTLPRGWRRLDDISWRATTWELRRIALSGMKLNSLTSDERKSLGLSEMEMALRVEHVGQISPHDAAKRAGLLKGDIVVAFDGKADFRRETDVIAYSLKDRQTASKVDVDILRNGKRIKVAMPIAN
jgi:S1-C subfamily serine protease